jgi:hypothetical protein
VKIAVLKRWQNTCVINLWVKLQCSKCGKHVCYKCVGEVAVFKRWRNIMLLDSLLRRRVDPIAPRGLRVYHKHWFVLEGFVFRADRF